MSQPMPSKSQHLSHQTKPHYDTPQLTPPQCFCADTHTDTLTHTLTLIKHKYSRSHPVEMQGVGGKVCPTVVVTSDLQHDGHGHMHAVCVCEMWVNSGGGGGV